MPNFKFSVDVAEVAATLGQTKDLVENTIVEAVRQLSISTHAFVLRKAQTELKGYAQEKFLEQDANGNAKYVRWTQVAKGFYVVELDESLRWIEEGRPATSMATTDWLLKGPVVPVGEKGVHRAKDGSLYRSIPITQARGAGGSFTNPKPALAGMVGRALKEQGISLRKIEKDAAGKPKLGILHKLNLASPEGFSALNAPGLFSQPRNQAMADLTGLQPHEGIFYLKDAVVTQREQKYTTKTGAEKTKIKKEVITFRTVSTKHQAEGRWMSPEVKPFNGMEAAFKYAEEEWEKILRQIDEEFRGGR